MSEHFGISSGFEHLNNANASKNSVDPNILIKDAEAVAKIFSDKIQNLNAADGLFFMQQVGRNLSLTPKQESFNFINANVHQNALAEETMGQVTGNAIKNLNIPQNSTIANNAFSFETTFNTELPSNKQVEYSKSQNLTSTTSPKMKCSETINKQKPSNNHHNANRKRETYNTHRIKAWLNGGNRLNHQTKEITKETTTEKSSEPIQSQVDNVVKYNTDWLKNITTQKQNDKKSLNILILGETGVGKSTWINAFANYLIYETLEEAVTAETPICVIPTKFTLFDNNNECHEIMLGEHDNECFENEGQSATQDAKTYLFETEKYNVYLIDTPGMNDTRGIEQDEENMSKILRAIAPFKELHAICFLFKPNETRLKDYFKYTINTLLNNLHKTSLNNACFVFTNTRTTLYKPGETLGLLEKYFNELNEKEALAVPIKDDNVFCLENEAFRFCCAYFSKVLFDATEIDRYKESWKHSTNEINRFLDYAATLSPHNTSVILSVNETRTWIMQLVNPIISVCDIIQTNIQKLEERMNELKSMNMKELQQRKFVQTVSLEIKPLEKPQTVCTSEKCIRFENIEGHMEPIFKTICHKGCGGTRNLLGCVAFGDKGRCRKCGCSYKEHMKIFYEQQLVTTDTEIEIHPHQKNTMQMKKKMTENTKQMIEKYKEEYNFVMAAMAKFSLFLAQNGVAQRYDIFESHIEDLIEKEEKLTEHVENYDEQKLFRLDDLLANYREAKKKLFDENNKLSLDEIQDIRQKLFAMPLTGSKIAEIFGIYVTAEQNYHAENITRCDRENITEQSTSWYQSVRQLLFG